MFVPAFPLHVVFILDTRCNLSCTHCSSSASRRRRDGFDTGAAMRAIDELAGCGVVDVALSGGEPLLRKDLELLVSHARSRHLTVGTSTNGYAMTPARAAKLRDAGLTRLQVSLDGVGAVHDAIRGRGAFDKALAALRISVAAGLRTHVCFTAMRSNLASLRECIALAVREGAHGFNLSQFVATGRGTEAEDLLPEQAEQALDIWREARAARPDLYFASHAVGPHLCDEQGGGCQAGRAIACVTAAGDVTPCVMFPYALGNLRERSFRDIWSGHALLRALRERRVEGVCGDCALRERCGGCRAAAWAHTGNPLAADHRCWQPVPGKEVPCPTSSSTARCSARSASPPASLR